MQFNPAVTLNSGMACITGTPPQGLGPLARVNGSLNRPVN